MKNNYIDLLKNNIPNDVFEILNILNKNGAGFVCGGAIRDILLGEKPNDFDFATNIEYDRLIEIFSPYVDTEIKGSIGKHFGIIIINYKGNIYEIAKFREDIGNPSNRKEQEINFVSEAIHDINRRDLTINSFMYDGNNTLLHSDMAIEDLNNGVIRLIGNANDRIINDPLRMLRVIRFSARYGFDISDSTILAIKDNCDLIKQIASERIRMELDKILLHDNVLKSFNIMHDTGLLKIILPELDMLYGYNQESKWHKYTLEKHILLSVERSPKVLESRLALLFHDIGKPETKSYDEDGDAHYYGHNSTSSKISRAILERLRYDKKTIETVSNLIYFHMSRFDNFGKKFMRKLVDSIGEENIYLLKNVWLGDESAHEVVLDKDINEYVDDKFNKIIEFINTKSDNIKIRDLTINGHDLIGVIPNIIIGKTLKKVLEMVLDDLIINEKNVIINYIKNNMEVFNEDFNR